MFDDIGDYLDYDDEDFEFVDEVDDFYGESYSNEDYNRYPDDPEGYGWDE